MSIHHGLDLARCPENVEDFKICKALRKSWERPGYKVPHSQIKILKERDYDDPPRYEGLGDTPSRVFKSPPEALRPLNQVKLLWPNISQIRKINT